jgi:uncharacterized membrane protein YesL
MIAALRVLGRAFGEVWDSFVLLAVLNLAWLGLSILVVTFPPATAALFEATRGIARGRNPDVRDLLDGVRRHFWRAWAWALVNVVVGAVIVVNVVFYGALDTPWARALQGIVVVLAVFWMVAQLLVWPYVFVQEQPRLRLAFRNAVFTVFGAPIFALTIGVFVLALVALSVLLVAPLAIFTVAFLALLGNLALIDRLRAFGKLPEPTDDEVQPEVGATEGTFGTERDTH